MKNKRMQDLILHSSSQIFLFTDDNTKIPDSHVKGAKAPYGKPLTGNLAFGTGRLRQERMAELSYERVNSTCAGVNSTTL